MDSALALRVPRNDEVEIGATCHLERHCEERSEAIQTILHPLDCFAEPVIGPRFARTRWLAMTATTSEPSIHSLICAGAVVEHVEGFLELR